MHTNITPPVHYSYIIRADALAAERLHQTRQSPQSSFWVSPLQWRHNGHDGVSNNQPHDCLLKRLFRHRSKKTSKLRVIGFWAGNYSPHKWPVTRKMFPFDDVIMPFWGAETTIHRVWLIVLYTRRRLHFLMFTKEDTTSEHRELILEYNRIFQVSAKRVTIIKWCYQAFLQIFVGSNKYKEDNSRRMIWYS